jgi:hypothetical protein
VNLDPLQISRGENIVGREIRAQIHPIHNDIGSAATTQDHLRHLPPSRRLDLNAGHPTKKIRDPGPSPPLDLIPVHEAPCTLVPPLVESGCMQAWTPKKDHHYRLKRERIRRQFNSDLNRGRALNLHLPLERLIAKGGDLKLIAAWWDPRPAKDPGRVAQHLEGLARSLRRRSGNGVGYGLGDGEEAKARRPDRYPCPDLSHHPLHQEIRPRLHGPGRKLGT